ncbi:carcinine hydrolase/isopenicillin-N N-acyltransferase family protein [Eudoraea chungangensis]|uniref:carcinine hydrolase/isopenicillin-N N-acyltransferase family protein n=1 Tax=Eudoraea chungangensis TaxID=1481905 RepID=UPI0023EE11E4|nr:carcinine hydrolase/isopenicillin-N N-acyltransferase family protein [Eudoraea chungangensis]
MDSFINIVHYYIPYFSKIKLFLVFFLLLIFFPISSLACSVLYYVDKETGEIYIANHEDYWYDTKAYIQIEPRSSKELARLWYGWDDFAQGGINEDGLFFDGAVTPKQNLSFIHNKPKGNLGDDILANCRNVKEALIYLEKRNIALDNAHIMFGDKNGEAVVVEWVEGKRRLLFIENNRLIMTNFLLSHPEKGNYPCPRYASIESRLQKLSALAHPIKLLDVGNTLGQAAQTPQKDKNNRIGGTLYSTFIRLSTMEFFLVSKLDNSKITKLYLENEFLKKKSQKIRLYQ